MFKVSTLKAAASGSLDSEYTRDQSSEFNQKIQACERHLQRRLPIGSKTNYMRLLRVNYQMFISIRTKSSSIVLNYKHKKYVLKLRKRGPVIIYIFSFGAVCLFVFCSFIPLKANEKKKKIV